MGVKLRISKHKKIDLYCDECGFDLYYYVDGNNGAISHNSKGVCKNVKCKKSINKTNNHE